jgi:hypothetical protein
MAIQFTVHINTLGNIPGLFEGWLYTKSQGRQNWGPTLSIFGLLFDPKLLINARTLTSEY